MTWHDEAEALRLGLVFIDEAFAAAKSKLGDAVPCARGCAHCCSGAALFEIHAADGALLAAGLEQADPVTGDAIRSRAHALMEQVREVAADLTAEGESLLEGWSPEVHGFGLPARVIEALASRVQGACPVLAPNGDCSLHAHRPAICRLQGVGWRDPETGADLPDFCTLDARQADAAPQDVALHRLDELREDARWRLQGMAGERGVPARTFVAAALLALLPER